MAWSPATNRRSWTGGCAATTASPTRGPPNSRPRWAVCAPTPPSLLAVWAWPEGLHEGTTAVLGARRTRRMSVAATRGSRMEKWYRRLLALYPEDHRREHAEEMVGVLLAADGDAQVRAPKPVAWALRLGQHAADSADLVDGALRIRGRIALNRLQRTHWLSWTVRDQRWSDALAVVSVVAPLLLPMAAGAPGVTLLVFLRLRRLAGLGALATAIGQIAAGAVPAFAGYADPAVAFTVLLSGTAAVALLLSPGPDRGLALLTPSGTALVGAAALILGGFSVGGDVWFGSGNDGAPTRFDDFGGRVAGLPADLLIAAVLVSVAAACLRAPVSRRVLALLAIPVIPYAFLWQEKLAVDLFGQPGGGSAIIPSSIPLLYLPPLLLASLVLFGTWLARRPASGIVRWAPRPPDPGVP